MHRKNYGKRSGVIVDWCGPHGTWLDADELEQIAHFIAGGGLRDAAGGSEARASRTARSSTSSSSRRWWSANGCSKRSGSARSAR
jgi:hypothetical protein